MPLNVLVKLSSVLKKQQTDVVAEIRTFFVKLQLFYQLDFEGHHRIDLLIPAQLPPTNADAKRE
jgi:hypothetical protein